MRTLLEWNIAFIVIIQIAETVWNGCLLEPKQRRCLRGQTTGRESIQSYGDSQHVTPKSAVTLDFYKCEGLPISQQDVQQCDGLWISWKDLQHLASRNSIFNHGGDGNGLSHGDILKLSSQSTAIIPQKKALGCRPSTWLIWNLLKWWNHNVDVLACKLDQFGFMISVLMYVKNEVQLWFCVVWTPMHRTSTVLVYWFSIGYVTKKTFSWLFQCNCILALQTCSYCTFFAP